MTKDEIKAVIVRALAGIAPETDAAQIAGNVDLREALDLDSMDFLNFIASVHEALHVDVPETDYPKMRTLDSCVTYLASRCA